MAILPIGIRHAHRYRGTPSLTPPLSTTQRAARAAAAAAQRPARERLCSAEEPQAPEQHEPGGWVYGAEGAARSECEGPGKSDNMASGAQRRKHVASLAARGR